MREIRLSSSMSGMWKRSTVRLLRHRQTKGAATVMPTYTTAPHLDSTCAVQRHGLSVGANPTRQLSLQPVAIGAVAEVTKRLKPLV